MHDFRADLHCHTTCSDGTVIPELLVKQAHALGLNALSITDHDSIDAYQTAMPVAQELKMPLLPGIELSTMHKEESIHILAYGFSLDNSDIHHFCLKQQQKRLIRVKAILQRLAKEGMPLDEEEVLSFSSKHSIGRPHIAMAMIKKGYICSIEEAFKYIGSKGSCYVSGVYPSVQEALEFIHKANAFAILAHPQLIKRRKIIQDLLEMPFDGLEGYYARFPRDQNEKWLAVALKKNWLVTGGSDFHGEVKAHSVLGSSWTNEETFNLLFKRFKSNSELQRSDQ